MGEHLIEASGKLCLLDNMLTYLHKELVFVVGLHLVAVWAHVLLLFFFPSLSSCSLVKGPPDPAVLSDDEDAGHTSGLHGVQR